MNKQVVEFVETKRLVDTFIREDVFCLSPSKGYLSIQKLAIWVLRKLGCFYREQVVTYKRHIIHTNDVMENLFKQRRSLLEEYREAPKKLLIGSADFAELMKSTEISQRFSFSAEYYYNRKIVGLEVEIIPWMKGIIVMP